jgi:hypothetical protein
VAIKGPKWHLVVKSRPFIPETSKFSWILDDLPACLAPGEQPSQSRQALAMERPSNILSRQQDQASDHSCRNSAEKQTFRAVSARDHRRRHLIGEAAVA